MAKKIRIYGKPIKHYNGYHIRPMLEGKLPSGKLGIFAGKNKRAEATSMDDAVQQINLLKK